MTQTVAKIETHHDVKTCKPGMSLLDAMADGSVVWNFEFGLLGFV